MSSSSSSKSYHLYNVFLSFRGEDTRTSFASSLYSALTDRSINTFMEKNLDKGAKVKPEFFRAIEGSRISIVVFSRRYAGSRHCLDELVKIMECHRGMGQVVVPVFYNVDPAHVRHQIGEFGDSYTQLLRKQRWVNDADVLSCWKRALSDAANFSGWPVTSDNKGQYVYELAEKIANWITPSLFSYDVFLSFSGMDTRYSFTSFLCNVLRHEGFKTFMDDEGLVAGNQISQVHVQAIEESKFSIIIFSENYAYSPCCLDAPVKILECKKLKKQRVLPVFYKVQPSDVRYQVSHYSKAMDSYESEWGKDSERVKKWRSALFEVASLKGWHIETGYEYKTVQGIVELVSKSLPRYDVFLSFRGRDTRNTFTGYLYYALCRRGIKTFMDDEALEGGEQISETLINAIQESRHSIIVFSENYATSSWCLDELVHILEWKRVKYHLVWPIYYKVEPSDVWHQRNSYARAMATHENRLGKECEKVQKWKSALSEVANLEKLHFETGYEYKFIDKVVEKVRNI